MPVYTNSKPLDEFMKTRREKMRSNVISSGAINDPATQPHEA